MDVLQQTIELVSINSVNPFRTVVSDGQTYGIGNESAVAEYLEAALRKSGFSVEQQEVQAALDILVDGQRVHIPRRYNLLAEKGSGKNSLLFFGHMDTVDVKGGWESDPFVATEKVVDGRTRLYGLGTNDMKSGLAAILAAAEVEPKGYKIKVAFLVDEEFWSFGAAKLLESSFLQDVKLAIVPEIAENDIRSTAQWIGLGRLGRSEYEFQVRGVACHGADAFIHPDAVNAVQESAKLQAELVKYCLAAKKEFTEENVRVTNSVYLNYQEGGRAILSVPESASFILDRSFLPNEYAEHQVAELEAFVKKCIDEKRIDPRTKVEVRERARPTAACKPYFFSSRLPQIQFIESIARQFAVSVEYGIGRSVADENRIAEKGICTAIVSPQGDGSHTSGEWVDAESVKSLAQILKGVCSASQELVDVLAAK